MDVRLALSDDYAIFQDWWQKRGFPAAPAEALPPTGIVITESKRPVAMGFIYRMEASTMMLEWIVRDPALSQEQASAALDLLLASANFWGKLNGYSRVFTFTSNKSLRERLNKFYKETDPNMVMFLGEL